MQVSLEISGFVVEIRRGMMRICEETITYPCTFDFGFILGWGPGDCAFHCLCERGARFGGMISLPFL